MDYENLVADILNELYKRLKNEINIKKDKKKLIVIGGFNNKDFEQLENIFEIVHYENRMQTEEYNCILISSLSLQMLGNIALSCGNCNAENFILKSLMEGKQIYLLESGIDYRKYKKTAFKPLYNLYSEYENKLLQYGINIISNPLDILSNKSIQSAIDVNTNVLEISLTGKSLLLECDLLKNHIKESSVIKINKNCIITPLAEDYIRSHNLIIKRV